MTIQTTHGQSSPHVSVVLVSFNTRELTLEAIESVFGSILDPQFRVEVIVVDNDSQDGSADAIESRFPAVRVIRSDENLGFGRGNNLGVHYATGQAILLLNTDTIVRPGAVECLYGELFSAPDRGVVGPFLENPDGSYQCSMLSFPTVWRTFCTYFWLDRVFPSIPLFADASMVHADPHAELDVDVINGAALMIRADVFRQVGGFDPEYFMYFEESDLCKRVAGAGYRSRYIPRARVLHFISQSSRSRPWWFHHIIRQSRMIYARKHMTPAARFGMAVIVHSGYALRIPLYTVIGLIKPRFKMMGRNMFKSYFHVDPPFAPRKNFNA
jgi:GT2 family glycosyltransferase